MNKLWTVLAALLLFVACTAQEPKADAVGPGDSITDFSVIMDDGTVLSSAGLAGSPSLIVFFNTTCADCRRTLPHVQTAYLNYGTKVRFVAISRAQAREDVSQWWAANGMSVPFSAQEDDKVYKLFAQSRIPRIFISGADGKVLYAYDDNPCPDFAELDKVLGSL